MHLTSLTFHRRPARNRARGIDSWFHDGFGQRGRAKNKANLNDESSVWSPDMILKQVVYQTNKGFSQIIEAD